MQSVEHWSSRSQSYKSNGALSRSNWAALFPPSVVAVGAGEQPVERLLTLQSAIAKIVHMVTFAEQLRFRLPLNAFLRLRLRGRSV
jgi:hypothetical protein